MPKVSVVIPVYNCQRFIPQTIQSVLNQTFQDFEIIVIDDGSIDGTDITLQPFLHRLLYRPQANQGAGVARNLGVFLARGEWVAFLDADDVWYPHKLAVQLEHAANRKEIGFFYSDMDVIDEDGHLILRNYRSASLPEKNEKPRLSFSVVFDDQPFPNPSTVMVRRDLFLASGGFNPLFRGKYNEDFELFARLTRLTKLHFIPQSLVQYRLLPKGHQDVPTWESNWLLLLSSLWDLWRDDPGKRAMLIPLLARYSSDQGNRCLKTANHRTARMLFRQAFGYKPFDWRNLARWGISYLPGLRDWYIRRKAPTPGSAAPYETLQPATPHDPRP